MSVEEKLSSTIKLAQSYILLFLKEHINSDNLTNIENLFRTCPIEIKQIAPETNEFGKQTDVGGKTLEDKIIISLQDIEANDITNEDQLNKLLGTIIHEYAHKIRGMNNQYGEMLEESFASIFAEVCINNARIKLKNNLRDEKVFIMQDSVNYQKYESQVRALLYVLNKNNLDEEIIAEYIAGNQEKFKQICTQILGDEFITYFESISSKNNQDSEQNIIEIITKYISKNGLSIENYFSPKKRYIMFGNLYHKGSPTLERAIVNSGVEKFEEQEKKFFLDAEHNVKFNNDKDAFFEQEKIDRVKRYVESKFSLNGKSIEEIYDAIIDLCYEYNIHKDKNSEESKIFVIEIKKMIPDIENFITRFRSLRVNGLDKSIFDTLDLNNPTYNDIVSSMNKLLQSESIENENLGGIKR